MSTTEMSAGETSVGETSAGEMGAGETGAGRSAAGEIAVRSALRAAGITPSEEEIEALVAGYGRVRGMVDLLHAVPAARYESPGLHFNPTPVFAEWG